MEQRNQINTKQPEPQFNHEFVLHVVDDKSLFVSIFYQNLVDSLRLLERQMAGRCTHGRKDRCMEK